MSYHSEDSSPEHVMVIVVPSSTCPVCVEDARGVSFSKDEKTNKSH